MTVVVISVAAAAYKPVYRIFYPLRYEEYIERYSYEYDLDKFLVMALIKAESNYIYDAHSGVARGLMQITAETAEWIAGKMNMELEENDIEDPQINISMGCYYLKYLIDYYNGELKLALAAYNAGMGNVNKWLADSSLSSDGSTIDVIPFGETERYIEKIEKGTKIYKKLYK